MMQHDDEDTPWNPNPSLDRIRQDAREVNGDSWRVEYDVHQVSTLLASMFSPDYDEATNTVFADPAAMEMAYNAFALYEEKMPQFVAEVSTVFAQAVATEVYIRMAGAFVAGKQVGNLNRADEKRQLEQAMSEALAHVVESVKRGPDRQAQHVAMARFKRGRVNHHQRKGAALHTARKIANAETKKEFGLSSAPSFDEQFKRHLREGERALKTRNPRRS